jgi:quercetin dioxygenase-like cupin family protein
MLEKINLKEHLKALGEYAPSKTIGDFNGFHIKLVRFIGHTAWTRHDFGDEFFLVINGRLTIEFMDKTVFLAEGELLIVPQGLEHRLLAEEETHALLLSPASLTEDVMKHELTQTILATMSTSCN